MITPANKDEVLNWLCLNLDPEDFYTTIDFKDLLEKAKMDFNTLSAILRYFERIGFIEELNLRSTAVALSVKVEAHDFAIRGGFVAQEELLEANIRKLLLEIEHLKPQLLDKGEKIAGISSAILAAIGLFKTS